MADFILASPTVNNLGFLNIEEYKFVENPEKNGVKTSLRPDKERKRYGLLLFNNLKSKDIGIPLKPVAGLSQEPKRS